MHKRVKNYFESIRQQLPHYFANVAVLDCGSLDINGNNRFLFTRCHYTGIDIVKGKNVDVVTRIGDFNPGRKYNVVISSEMLEHDQFYADSLHKMLDLLEPNGLLLFTAAGTGRPEHGTADHHPDDSPLTHNYYKNITVQMIAEAINLELFSWFEISYLVNDIRFAGIKK